jgi:DNA-binding Lrp family transcriptional regulator
MDSLDIGIVRTMGIRPFARWPPGHAGIRPTGIARELGVTEQTVRDRIARMESDGVVRGYHLLPNLRHVAVDVESVHWELGEAPDDETLGRLQAVDGVLAALRFYGPHVCFDVSHASRDQRRRRLQNVEYLLGEIREVLWSHDLAFPDVDRELSAVDWRIVRARRTDARRPATAVAEAVGVSAKTVRTRYDAMLEEGSVVEYASVDFAAMRDSVPFILYVWFSEGGPDPTAPLLELTEDHRLDHFRATVPDSGLIVTQLVASNPAEVQQIVDAVLEIDGVDRAEPQMPTGGFWNEAWIDEIVDARSQVQTA